MNPNCSLSDQNTFVSVNTSNILPSATKACASCATARSLTILRNIKVRPHPLPGFECRSIWQHRPDPPAKQLSSFQSRPDLFWSAAFNREVVVIMAELIRLNTTDIMCALFVWWRSGSASQTGSRVMKQRLCMHFGCFFLFFCLTFYPQ